MSARAFDHTTTCDDVLEGVDVSGKAAMVTGASGGLGAEAARSLAAKGCKVTLVARDEEKTQGVIASIRDAHPEADVDYVLMELSEPNSVNAGAEQWLGSHSQLDMLILNAGVMACPLMRTSEGWEMQLATNHFGHFLLTSRLMGVLQASSPARVVSLSSAGHRISPVRLEDPHFNNADYDPWMSYGQSKTANIWFANELDRRYKSQGVRAYSVHPGVIYTNLSRHLSEESLKALGEQMKKGSEEPKSEQAGAASSIFAATAPELADHGGVYIADCQVIDENSKPYQRVGDHAFDADSEAKLWAMTEETMGFTFAQH